MSTANGKRSADAIVVTALATNAATYDEAAAAAAVSRATVARRMKEPPFRARVAEEREQVVESVRGRLAASAPAAAEAIADLAINANSESTRLAAATRVLDYALRRKPGFDTFDSAEVPRSFAS